MSKPVTVIAIYRVRSDSEDRFVTLLRKHHPALHAIGLVTDDPPVVYRGTERDGRPIYFEIFSWKDAEAPKTAHQMPEVLAVWEPMGALAEERDGKPKFEFPHVELLDLAVGQS